MQSRMTRPRFLGAATPAPPAATPAPTKVAEKEIVEITWAVVENPAGLIKPDHAAHLAAGEATRIRLRMLPVPKSDFEAKMNTWLATNTVPDIMEVWNPEDVRYFAASALLPIMPLVDEYGPNLKRYLEAQPELKRWTAEGIHYLVPKMWYNRRTLAPAPHFRTDWLDELGLPVPEDFDQLYEVLTELKKAHPDAYWTGRNGIHGKLIPLVSYAMGSGKGGWYVGRDSPYFDKDVDGGKWLYGPVQPEMKDVLAYLAKAYKEGILDPDVASTTDAQWDELNRSDRGFFGYDNFMKLPRWIVALREKNPKATWAPVATFKGKRGRRQSDFNSFDGGLCLGATSKHPDRAIELLDWLITPIGLDTCNWGIEGVHYTLKEPRAAVIEDYTMEGVGKAMPTEGRELKPEIFDKYTKLGGVGFGADICASLHNMVILSAGSREELFQPTPGEADAWYEMSENDPGLHKPFLAPALTTEELERLKEPMTNVATIINPALDKVVLGQITLSDYDKAVEEAIKAGALEMEKIYNDAEARMK